ncbi:MAG: hypothetical protein AABX73_01735 [Nanoarchaeota archaeon]
MEEAKLEEISDRAMEEMDRELRGMLSRAVRRLSDIPLEEDYYGTGSIDILGKSDLKRQRGKPLIYNFD